MNMKYCFKKASGYIADLFYPRHCALCGKVILGTKDLPICTKCDKIKTKPKVVRDDKFFFDEVVAAVQYKGKTRDAMIKYKFKSIKYYSHAYAHLIDLAYGSREDIKDALLCHVPMSKGRRRPYNQTAVIAELLCEKWGLEYIPDLLYKCREVNQLSKMKLTERRFYIKDAIDVNIDYDVCGKDIVIIDDIYTSGTTANECARTLKMYGADRVFVLCACYD